jgi:hypothetical protein
VYQPIRSQSARPLAQELSMHVANAALFGLKGLASGAAVCLSTPAGRGLAAALFLAGAVRFGMHKHVCTMLSEFQADWHDAQVAANMPAALRQVTSLCCPVVLTALKAVGASLKEHIQSLISPTRLLSSPPIWYSEC